MLGKLLATVITQKDAELLTPSSYENVTLWALPQRWSDGGVDGLTFELLPRTVAIKIRPPLITGSCPTTPVARLQGLSLLSLGPGVATNPHYLIDTACIH